MIEMLGKRGGSERWGFANACYVFLLFWSQNSMSFGDIWDLKIILCLGLIIW
jgi:hypothetical protein